VDRFARVVLGYHGCRPDFADALISGASPVRNWQPSQNLYDWIGHGIYFWEHAPERAKDWGEGGVVGAVIQLGTCLDLTMPRYTAMLGLRYQETRRMYLKAGTPLPRNRGKRRDRDCLVINDLISAQVEQGGTHFQTVRCPFVEGKPAFPGSAIFRDSHIQVAVLDTQCILGVFRPNFG
jgi:hypothetical protein